MYPVRNYLGQLLCVVKDLNDNIKRASRNVSGLTTLKSASDLNAYDVLNREKVVIERDALAIIEARLLLPRKGSKVERKES